MVVVSDTVWVSRGKPSLSSGLRGLQRFIFRLETAETDQHSGTTGGVARNPISELCQLASEIFDGRTGRVKIPGFYDDVEPLSARERKDFLGSGFSVPRFMKDHGFKSIRTRDPLDVMKRLWALPTFELHGIVGGYTGPGREDDRAAARGDEGDRPPGAEHEGREAGAAGEGVREEAEPRRDGRGRDRARPPTGA